MLGKDLQCLEHGEAIVFGMAASEDHSVVTDEGEALIVQVFVGDDVEVLLLLL